VADGLARIASVPQPIRDPNSPVHDGLGTACNPDLERVNSDHSGLSLEWFCDKRRCLPAAVFRQNIDSTICLGVTRADHPIGSVLFPVNACDKSGGTKISGMEPGTAQPYQMVTSG
jgi:hypothetical protein